MRHTAGRIVALGVTLGLLTAAPLEAAAPPARTQAPGYYRFALGSFEVTALLDGTIKLDPAQSLKDITPGEATQLLEKEFVRAPVETSINAFLINTGNRLVLVDTGVGSLLGASGGHLLDNLRAAGYEASQVDDILISHMHGDHIGGLLLKGERAFSNATVHADKLEADLWLDRTRMAQATAEARQSFEWAMQAFAPYIAAGKFVTFSGESQIAPGISTRPAYGHTPGHSFYVLASGQDKLVFWGDLLHFPPVQFPRPAVTVRFDNDPALARQSREKEFAAAAAGGYWIAVAHISFPGIGHIRTDGNGYRWVPALYSLNQ